MTIARDVGVVGHRLVVPSSSTMVLYNYIGNLNSNLVSFSPSVSTL
jgi:hypothetical protein